MKPNNKLVAILSAELNWNKRRIECFVQMLLALMVVRTINLTKIAVQIRAKAKLPNKYRHNLAQLKKPVVIGSGIFEVY